MQTPAEAPESTPVTVWAQWLGYAGLIPFVTGAALVWLVWPPVHPYASWALATYAAVIVSFLGGIHWGATWSADLGVARSLLWGVCPSLLAWVGALMPARSGLILMGAVLILSYLVDRSVYPRYGLQRWLRLRLHLSTVAALSCWVGAAGA